MKKFLLLALFTHSLFAIDPFFTDPNFVFIVNVDIKTGKSVSYPSGNYMSNYAFYNSANPHLKFFWQDDGEQYATGIRFVEILPDRTRFLTDEEANHSCFLCCCISYRMPE